MSRIRIVHVITKLELGGAQGNTLYTVSHLDPEKFEVHLITGRGGLLDAEAAGIPNVSVRFCDDLVREIRPWSDWKAYRYLKRSFESLKPDIVHTHSSKAGIVGRWSAADAGVPGIIHTYHGFGFHTFQNPLVFRAYVAAERAACRRAHHLVFVSRDNWKWADQLRLTDGCEASLIRSGIPVREIRAAAAQAGQLRGELNIPPDSRIVGMIACLKQQKDPCTFVRACGILQRQNPQCHFVLVGDGELQQAVRAEVAKLPQPESFHFLGWRRDVYAILHGFDVLALTSLWEGLPRVIPEAIVSGIPVVASDIDGNRELLLDGRSGVLAKPGDERDFSAKISAALTGAKKPDPVHASEVSGDFDIDDMITALQNLYIGLSERR